MFSPNIIANDFIIKANKEDIGLTPMKLQKLIYFLFGYYYAETDKKLFNEPFEVWQYGPVLPSVYSEFRSFRSNHINALAKDAKGKAYVPSKSDPELKDYFRIFDIVWEKYKDCGGIYLSKLTHKEGTPWHKSYKSGAHILNSEDIKNYFKEHKINE